MKKRRKVFHLQASGKILHLTHSGWSGILLEMEMKAPDLFQRNVIYYRED